MKSLTGIIAAALTPVSQDFAVAADQITDFLAFLSQRGCHGALLLGTTGEGPSFGLHQREMIYQAAGAYRFQNPKFILLAGTGLPALQDTIQHTRLALDAGLDGAVVLPPYYYKSLSVDALYDWYGRILDEAVPEGKWLLGYHFPRMTGVPLELELLERLASDYAGRFVGVKDSSGDPRHLEMLRTHLPTDFAVFSGNDKLLSAGLRQGAAGTISSLANLASPLSRRIWDSFHSGQEYDHYQFMLDDLRVLLDEHPPAPAFLKATLPQLFNLSAWQVYPPLSAFQPAEVDRMLSQLTSSPAYEWLQKTDDPTA